MVIDTSGAFAVLTGEPGSESMVEALAGSAELLMSAGTTVELGIVFESRYGPAGGSIIERFIREAGIEIVSVDRDQAGRAMEGWRRFGKGRHPAGLNFGDCFTYALGVSTGYPVLCVGTEFAQAGMEVVVPGTEE
ncbi:MAG: type II toxin-antitoxin system VapC family toxin [Actinomycetota bacterium]